MARVIIPSMMRDVTGGIDAVEVPGTRLKEVVAGLVARFPGLAPRLLDEAGALHHYLAFFVDGVEVKASEGFLFALEPGAEVVIVPALGGGR